MPDVVKQAFDAIKDSQLFLDEADFREQLSKSPKDVYGVLETTGLFLDYEDFSTSMALKKKDQTEFPEDVVEYYRGSEQEPSVSEQPPQETPTPSELPKVNGLEKGVSLKQLNVMLSDLPEEVQVALKGSTLRQKVNELKSIESQLPAQEFKRKLELGIGGEFQQKLTGQLSYDPTIAIQKNNLTKEINTIKGDVLAKNGTKGFIKLTAFETLEEEDAQAFGRAVDRLDTELGERSPYYRRDMMNQMLDRRLRELDIAAYPSTEEGVKALESEIRNITGQTAWDNGFILQEDGTIEDKFSADDKLDQYIQEEGRVGFGKELVYKLASGIETFSGGMMDVLGFVTGLGALESWQQAATGGYMRSEELRKVANRYDQSVEEYTKEGDVVNAAGAAVSQTVESLPNMLPMLFNPQYGVYVMGATSGAQKLRELEDVPMDKWKKYYNAGISALNEIMWEKLFTVPILMKSKKALSEIGESAVRKNIPNLSKKIVSTTAAGMPQSLQEGFSEGATRVFENVIDYLTYDSDRKIGDGVFDAVTSGVLLGKFFTLPQNAAWMRQKFGTPEATKKYIKEIISKLPFDISQESKLDIAEKIIERDKVKDKDPALKEDGELERLNTEIKEDVKKAQTEAKEVKTIETTTEGEMVAQNGDKAPLTATEAIPVEALKDVESTAKAIDNKNIKESIAENIIPNDFKEAIKKFKLTGKQQIIKIGDVTVYINNNSTNKTPTASVSRLKSIYINLDTLSDAPSIIGMEGVDVNAYYALLHELKHIEGIHIPEEYKDWTKSNQEVEATENADKWIRKFQTSKTLSEAYHAAKADGSNPQLVEAVESLLGQETVQQPIGEQPIADVGGVTTPDVSQDRTMAAEATREGIVASFDIQPKQIKEKEFGFVQKELTKAWTDWKKANQELKKMPQRVQNIMREKVIRMTPETKDKTMEFLTRVMTNETYAKQVNSVAEKLEKYGKTKPIGEMRPFVRALMKIPPKARYFYGKDEMRIMLGKMDISNEIFTNKMLAELDSALDDVTAKKQDFTKLIDFVTTYQDQVQRALIQNVRDVDVNSRAIPKFISALDKLETQKELVEEQLLNNELDPQDVISLQKRVDGLERWIKNMKKEGAIKEITTEEGKKIREAEDRLKYLEDFLNNGYNELQEKARNLYDEATEGAKNVLLNDIKDSNTTSEVKEVSEAIENIKKSAAILLENSNGRKFLNLSKLDMLKHALNQYKETGVLVKDFWSSEQEINTAAKAGRVMELTEKMQGLKGWLQKRRVSKIADSPKALSALYTDLVDMYIGIEGKNNAPYYESLGYQFDLAATRAKIETRNDLKKVNEAFMKALNKTQLGKIINLEGKKDFITLKRIGMVYASLRHYHLQSVEPILKDGKYYAVNKDTGETSQPFNTIEQAQAEIDSNKEKYVGNLDLVQSLLDKDAQSKANLSSNSIKNKMLLDADMEAYKSLSKDGLIVRNMDDAKKLLKPEEFQAMVALMDFYTKYQEKAKIVANRAGKDLDLEQFYMPFNLYTEFSDGVMADNVNNLINTASNEAGVTLTGRVESKQKETNAWINFNAMDVVHNYAADMNVSYHLLPLLKQEMGAFKRLKDMYHAMRDSERDGFSNSDMSKIASNMLEDRMQRFRNEVKMGVIFGDMSVGFMLGDKYIDVGKGLRRIQRVSRVKKLLDVVRPILDGAPQIMRQVAEGVGLTGIGYEQFNAKRIQELTELYEYVPEGSAMAEVLDTSMNRFDMPNWTVGTESTLQQFTSFMLSQADRLTKQMGWSAMFDKQCMELMGSTIDMKRFRGDEVYRNSVLKDPLFDKAVTLADRYTSSVHFARTSGASRGNILGGKFGLKQGTSAYALFTPLMSYMLHQSQYALSSVSNTLFGSELGRTQEARRVLGVIANNMTYSILAGSVLTLRKILIAKMADREEEEKELWKEFKDRFTREGAWNNVVGGTVQLIASSGGAFGPNVMNTLVSVGETLLTESESDGVKTRLAKKRWSEFRKLTGTGLYEIGDLKKGKISLKHVANTALPLLGGEIYDLVTGSASAISYAMYAKDSERDKVMSENEQLYAMMGLINDIVALGLGGYFGAKDVEKISDGMTALARKKPMNLKIMDYQDYASFYRTIQSAYEAEIKNIEYRETKEGELKYRIEYEGEIRIMTQQELDELIETVGDRNIINNKGINSYARAEAMMDSEFSYPDYEFTKEHITYRQFQAGMEKNELQNKWLMDTYEYIQTERSIPLEKKYELFRALEEDTEGLAKAVWNNEYYDKLGNLVDQWIEKELMNIDKKVALKIQESITNVNETIKKYK